MDEQTIKWRVRATPQMSANVFAEYMAVGEKARESLIQKSHYQSTFVTSYYVTAKRAIRHFLLSPRRDWGPIQQAKESLNLRASRPGIEVKMRERLLHNVGALESFEAGLNKLAITGYRLSPIVKRQPHLKVGGLGGLRVSVNLDFLIEAVVRKEDRVGGMLFTFNRRSPPQQLQAKARYERVASHAAAMVHMHIVDHFSDRGKASPSHCLWIDNHLGVAHKASADYKTLVENMERAGRSIAKDWNEIPPPKTFDPAFAEYGT